MIDPYTTPESNLTHHDHDEVVPGYEHLLLSFKGRIGRRGFWVGFTAVMAVEAMLVVASFYWPVSQPWIWLFTIPALYTLFAVTAKRYHDQGKSGWLGFIWIAPFVGWMFVIIECGFGRGSPMRNQYGAPLVGPLAGVPRKRL